MACLWASEWPGRPTSGLRKAWQGKLLVSACAEGLALVFVGAWTLLVYIVPTAWPHTPPKVPWGPWGGHRNGHADLLTPHSPAVSQVGEKRCPQRTAWRSQFPPHTSQVSRVPFSPHSLSPQQCPVLGGILVLGPDCWGCGSPWWQRHDSPCPGGWGGGCRGGASSAGGVFWARKTLSGMG